MSRHREATVGRRVRWREGDARVVLAEAERSGLPLAAFAVNAGLEPQRLYRWRRRLAESGGSVSGMPTFSEVRVQPLYVGHDPVRFEVVLTTGRVVRVPTSFDAEALRVLLAVVEGSPGGAC